MPTTEIIAQPGIPQIIITREFDASPELLFRAHTDPELLIQWLGPRRLKTVVDYFDVRDGGRWRYRQSGEDGVEHAFHGVFHGTPTVDGIVQTFEYEGAPGHVALDTATFERRGSRTLLRTVSSFQSVEDRDAMVEAGMAEGVNDGMERLEELIERLVAVR